MEFASLQNYDQIVEIRKTFPPLQNINLNIPLPNLNQSKFFIIRTQGENNVHKAMKYGIWTSSSRKNERLNEAYKNVKKQNGDVYLFFTEINSLCFSGMAKLDSEFDHQNHFKYWFVENKWFGTFKIQWLYVKDLPFKLFEDLKQIQKLDGSEEALKSVYDLIDCTDLNYDNGVRMSEIFQKEEGKTSLFEHFIKLDQLEYECRQDRDNNPKFDKKFKELAAAFEQIPFSFSVASYERKKMKKAPYYQGGYPPYYQQYQYGYWNQQYQYPNGGYYYPPQQYYYQQPYQNNGFYQKPQPQPQQQQQQDDLTLTDQMFPKQQRKPKFDRKKKDQ
ncbi:hypothetical protein pb186bvf_010653 [Paramecium bursaria]